MQCSDRGGDPINSFALVAYIPGALGVFLNELRATLVPGCTARSHVSILPPREIKLPIEQAQQALRAQLLESPAFELELTSIESFCKSCVIYVEFGKGGAQLKALHERLNEASLPFAEPYSYHPHVTLAQNITQPEVNRLLEEAKRQWECFHGSKRFEVDELTFVQNTEGNVWRDLDVIHLMTPVSPHILPR